MKQYLDTATNLLSRLQEKPDKSVKYLGETALTARVLYRLGHLTLAELTELATTIFTHIHTPDYMGLGDNCFDLRDHILPYACLREFMPESPYYAAQLKFWLTYDTPLHEVLPYQNCETQYFKYLTGALSLPFFGDVGWQQDIQNLTAFSENECYVFTHRHFYATDFGLTPRPRRGIKAALWLLLVKADLWQNADLVFETAICLSSENLTLKDWHLLDHIVSRNLKIYDKLCTSKSIDDYYHETYVLAIYHAHKARYVQSLVKNNAKTQAQYERLKTFYLSLAAKDPEHMELCLQNLETDFDCSQHFLELTQKRIEHLTLRAEMGVLFEREKSILGKETNNIDYAAIAHRFKTISARLGTQGVNSQPKPKSLKVTA